MSTTYKTPRETLLDAETSLRIRTTKQASNMSRISSNTADLPFRRDAAKRFYRSSAYDIGITALKALYRDRSLRPSYLMGSVIDKYVLNSGKTGTGLETAMRWNAVEITRGVGGAETTTTVLERGAPGVSVVYTTRSG